MAENVLSRFMRVVGEWLGYLFPLEGEESGYESAQGYIDPGHRAKDYSVVVGTRLYAPMDGIIHIYQCPPLPADQTRCNRGYGNYIEIESAGEDPNGNRYSFLMAHLSRFVDNLSEGARVVAGQTVGFSGGAEGSWGEGNSDGPHLHLEIHKINRGGVEHINPATFRWGEGGEYNDEGDPDDPPTPGDGDGTGTGACANPEGLFEQLKCGISKALLEVPAQIFGVDQDYLDDAMKDYAIRSIVFLVGLIIVVIAIKAALSNGTFVDEVKDTVAGVKSVENVKYKLATSFPSKKASRRRHVPKKTVTDLNNISEIAGA